MQEVSQIASMQERLEGAEISNTSLKAVVMEKGEVIPATSVTKSRFYVILADKSGGISATVYDEKASGKFIKGFGVKLENVMVKKGYLAVTSRSRVSLSPAFDIPEAIRSNLPALPGSNRMSIREALTSPVKTLTSIKGKVLQTSPVTKKNVFNKEVDFQEVVLQDQTTATTIAVWDTLTNTLEAGDLVHLTKCRVKLFNENKKLTTTDQTTCEKVSDDPELNNLPPLDDNNQLELATDRDAGMTELTFDSILDIDPYLSCPNPRCANKKLKTEQTETGRFEMRCEGCMKLMPAGRTNHYAVAMFSVNKAEERLELSMFLPEIKKLYESTGRELSVSFDKHEFMLDIVSVLPITASCKIRGKTIVKIVPKHKL